MILIIDAYNILKQIVSDRQVSEHERDLFVKQLGLYAKKRDHTIIAVFDGGPDERAVKDYVHGIYVVYSGIYETADDYIKSCIEKNREHELLLVSSDRALVESAERYEVESIDSGAFYAIVRQVLTGNDHGRARTTKKIVKTTNADTPELDMLMYEHGARVPRKGEDEFYSRKSSGHKASKKEKQMLKKIRKL